MFARPLLALVPFALLVGCSDRRGGVGPEPDTPVDYVDKIITGLTPESLSAWRAARDAVQSGQARASIAAVGDSTTAGWGSGGDAATNAHAGAWPTLFAQDLASAGLPARQSSFFGDGGFMVQLTSADHRLSYSPNWAPAGEPSIGGYPLSGNSTEGALHFAPDQDFDTIVVWDGDGTTQAPMTVKVEDDEEGGTDIIPPPTPRPNAGRTEAMVMRGRHVVTVSPTLNDPTYGQARLLGIETYDSSLKDVAVHNLGFSGSTTAEWTKTGYPYAPLTVLAQLAPKLTFINLGINDMAKREDVAIFTANLRKIVAAARKSGSVVLVVPNRTNPGYTTDQVQDTYDKAIEDLAAELHLLVASLPKLLGSYNQAKAAGMMSDDTHLSGKGYALVAEALSQVALAK